MDARNGQNLLCRDVINGVYYNLRISIINRASYNELPCPFRILVQLCAMEKRLGI
jgi:hypothetical protein